MKEEKKDNQTIDDLVEHLKPLVEQMKHIHDMAVVAYTPLVIVPNQFESLVKLVLLLLRLSDGGNKILELFSCWYHKQSNLARVKHQPYRLLRERHSLSNQSSAEPCRDLSTLIV